jgi:hypothetical protein
MNTLNISLTGNGSFLGDPVAVTLESTLKELNSDIRKKFGSESGSNLDM